MADETHIRNGARVLREFFAARNAEALKRAAAAVSEHFHLALSPGVDWTGAEYDFNRLFVGPMAVPAPPYASAYQTEPALMGAPTLDVRAAYRALGLRVPDQGSTPDDHLAFELDLAAALPGPGEGSDEEPESRGVRAEVRAWLLGEHLPGWVPAFIQAVRTQPDVTGPVRMAVDALEDWLETARSAARTGDA